MCPPTSFEGFERSASFGVATQVERRRRCCTPTPPGVHSHTGKGRLPWCSDAVRAMRSSLGCSDEGGRGRGALQALRLIQTVQQRWAWLRLARWRLAETSRVGERPHGAHRMTSPTAAARHARADSLDRACQRCSGLLLAEGDGEPPKCLQCGRSAAPAPTFREPGHEPLLSTGPTTLVAGRGRASERNTGGLWPVGLPDLGRGQ